MNLDFEIIDYASPLYQEVLNLRNEVLRKPLGLNLFDEDLTEDRDQYIVIAKIEAQVVACVMLKILDKDTIKIRQMAVLDYMQSKRIGSLLFHYAENFCALNEYYHIELNARQTAIEFYLKQGYQVVGEEFIEVGMPHMKMIKHLE